MPYLPRHEFRRQQQSLWVQAYGNRAHQPTYWNDYDTYLPQDALGLRGLDAWMQQLPAGVRININGIHAELLSGIQNYAAILEGFLHYKPLLFQPTAVATVLYDIRADRFYYGTSGFVPQMHGMHIQATLMSREQQLPANAQGIRTLVGNRHARTCSEFKALNRALWDGAQEADLHVWSFRVRSMRPMPQCPNCRITVPRNNLGRLWTG